MNPERESQAADALSELGVSTFVQLLRAARSSSRCTAVATANELLDSGQSVQDIFFTGSEFGGYYLSVEEESAGCFLVRFGYAVGGVAGDGEAWRVIVDRHGQVVRSEGAGFWIH